MANTLMQCENSPTAVCWTRQDCVRLEQAGVLNYRYELVEGVINKMGQNISHANIVRLLLVWLFRTFGEASVLTQTSIEVHPEDNPTSEPQTDAIVLTRSAENFTQNPRPVDIRSLIEASDSSLNYDLTVKAGLYARAGISEYWVVNFPQRCLHLHRNPHQGVYRDVVVYAETETFVSETAPQSPLQPAQFLPPAP